MRRLVRHHTRCTYPPSFPIPRPVPHAVADLPPPCSFSFSHVRPHPLPRARPVHAAQIFFPRSVEGEVASRHATREKSQTFSRPAPAGGAGAAPPGAGAGARGDSRQSYYRNSAHTSNPDAASSTERGGASPLPPKRLSYGEPTTPVSLLRDDVEGEGEWKYPPGPGSESDHHGLLVPPSALAQVEAPSAVFSPNRRGASGVVVAGAVAPPPPSGGARLTERALADHNARASGVHPFLHNFTSPIGESFSFSYFVLLPPLPLPFPIQC